MGPSDERTALLDGGLGRTAGAARDGAGTGEHVATLLDKLEAIEHDFEDMLKPAKPSRRECDERRFREPKAGGTHPAPFRLFRRIE